MIILDTHIWHWWINQIPGRLSKKTVELIEQADRVGVSAISCFEMAWLVEHKRIELSMTFTEWLVQVKQADIIEFLPVNEFIATQAVLLPEHHKDPQDRLIIATAVYHQASLISFDGAFADYQEIREGLIGKNK